jgi:restriction system protein
MTMPKFYELFNRVLESLSDGQEIHRADLQRKVAESLALTDEEMNETMSGGGRRIFSRIHWAAEHLVQAGAIGRPRRGNLQITDYGRTILVDYPKGISLEEIKATPGVSAWTQRSIAKREARNSESTLENNVSVTEFHTDESPLENVESAFNIMKSALAGELLDRIRNERPDFLEKLVLNLLHKMGYGATPEDIQHLGGSGDEGVDGVIHHDQLGLDKIYIQAKRYKDDSTIGRPAIQSFVGALSGKKATRGVFIATTKFSKDAYEYVAGLTGFTVVLIDGNQLADFMIQNKVGVTVEQSFELLGIDENFFNEEF